MSVSLLDLLTCGLAAVIILLMIALNSGRAVETENTSAVFVEIKIYGPVAVANDEVRVHWRGNAYALPLIEDGFSQVVKYLEFPDSLADLESIIAISIHHAKPLPPKTVEGLRMEWGTEFLLAMPSLDGEHLTLEVSIHPPGQGDAYYMQATLYDAAGDRERTRRSTSGGLVRGPSCLRVDHGRVATVLASRPDGELCPSSGNVLRAITLTGSDS